MSPFRAGRTSGQQTASHPHLEAAAAAGTVTYCADISEYQPNINDAAYLAWSKAVVIRAMYGDTHDDNAWYGGARRAALHAGGAQFVGIYQYLRGGQDGAAQAQAFHQLVGAIQPGEVFIADFEEGAKPVLTAWYNRMLTVYGDSIAPYLWTYTGLNFGETEGVLPVHWIADYSSVPPAPPHLMWQFTDSYNVPGVGVADCSVFGGPVSQLAAYAYEGKPVPVPTVASWTCQGLDSLAALCAGALHCQVSTVLRLTAGNSPQRLYTAAMASYLNGVFAADKAKVPAGVTVWRPKGSITVPFASKGDQTLQGLANAWGCPPSTIVRMTAENMPGGEFDAGMAAYLNSVFQRSATHVPAGVILYYQGSAHG